MTDALETNPAVDPALLALLVDADRPLSIDALAGHLNRTPESILAGLTTLRQAGCTLEEQPAGVALQDAGLGTWLDYLQHHFGKSRPMHVYRATRSTQDVCRRLVEARGPAAHGAIIVASEQSAGRGRLGRPWTAPPQSAVMFSMVHRLDTIGREEAVDRLTFATSVALVRALDRWLEPLHQRAMIRWPNDIYVDQVKLAGILVETMRAHDTRAAIIGIGLNVALTGAALAEAQAGCERPITSLHQLGASAPRLAVLGQALASLDAHLNEATLDDMLDLWRRRSDLIEQHVTLNAAGQQVAGHVVDIDPRAGLIVRTHAGTLTHLPAASTSLV